MDLAETMKIEENRAQREQELIEALELNRYQLEHAEENVKSLRAKRLELITESRSMGFTAKELAKLTGLKPDRVYKIS
jgi:hypothetical protein